MASIASHRSAGESSPASLGRRLVDAEKKVTVRASIHTLDGLSAHAGQDEQVRWFAGMAPARAQLIPVRGEDRAGQAPAQRIESERGIRARIPDRGT